MLMIVYQVVCPCRFVMNKYEWVYYALNSEGVFPVSFLKAVLKDDFE